MKTIFSLLLLTLVIQISYSTLGVDNSAAFTLANYQCLKQNGYSFDLPRAWHSYGGLDTSAVSNLNNAQQAGMLTDVYMFPCCGKSAADQVSQMITGLGSAPYGIIWLDIQTNTSPNCGWKTDTTWNCNYLGELVAAVKSHGKVVGIYASRYMWTSIFGAQGNCAQFTSLPVWYASYDSQPNFNNWSSVSFGGWTKPSVKQYKGTTIVCGVGVDLNYY